MMNEKQFIESQKECADMLGMSLSEYQDYCKNLKVPTDKNTSTNNSKNMTNEILELLEMDKGVLKTRKDC